LAIDTIVGDGGSAPLLLQDDVAAAWAERHLDGVGEGVHATLEPAACLLVESDHLRHGGVVPFQLLVQGVVGTGARDGGTPTGARVLTGADHCG
jgi:hypothetical protein